MPSFTEIELQKKFCEGFTFFPFKSLEQHGTLIYKLYSADTNVIKLLEWNTREHDSSHYATKITRKLKNTDVPAVIDLLQVLKIAGDWLKDRLDNIQQYPFAPKIARRLSKYRSQLNAYHKNVLQPTAVQLADKYYSFDFKINGHTEELMKKFIRETDVFHTILKDHTPGMTNDEDREHLSKIIMATEAFSAQQKRNIYLLDAWKTQQMLHNSRMAMN